MNYGNCRRMWKHIPTKRKVEIAKMIEDMPQSLDKDVLTLLFIEDMSSGEAEQYAANNNLCIGKRNKPIGRRRMEQIAKQYVPDAYDYTPKSATYQRRKVHIEELQAVTKDKCARCGCAENLELDHIIPLAVGGTTDDINLQILCRKCHMIKTAYERTIFPDAYKTYKNRAKEYKNGQTSLV